MEKITGPRTERGDKSAGGSDKPKRKAAEDSDDERDTKRPRRDSKPAYRDEKKGKGKERRGKDGKREEKKGGKEDGKKGERREGAEGEARGLEKMGSHLGSLIGRKRKQRRAGK